MATNTQKAISSGSQPPSGIFRLLETKNTTSLMPMPPNSSSTSQGSHFHCFLATMPALKVSITMTPVTAMP